MNDKGMLSVGFRDSLLQEEPAAWAPGIKGADSVAPALSVYAVTNNTNYCQI